MIAIDTSAIIAILQREPERDQLFDRIADAPKRMISAVSVLEASMVMHGRLGADGLTNLSGLLRFIDAEIVPFDREQAQAALDAFIRYGKGNHAKARLNMGDCASYALAQSRRIPLLFKGQDFVATDIVSAI